VDGTFRGARERSCRVSIEENGCRLPEAQSWNGPRKLGAPSEGTLRMHNRAKGPAVCLAQPNGLVFRVPELTTGPKARPFAKSLGSKRMVRKNQYPVFTERPVFVLESAQKNRLHLPKRPVTSPKTPPLCPPRRV
jgi:hypothetical protein